MRLRAFALHYTRDHPCLRSQYLLSRVEGSANALICCLRKMNCILCLQPSARTPHGTTHSYGPPYTSAVFTRAGATSTNPIVTCCVNLHDRMRSSLVALSCLIRALSLRVGSIVTVTFVLVVLCVQRPAHSLGKTRIQKVQ